MNKNNYCVIMAGGIGSRFWPISRRLKPKQFLDILGVGKTLLQQTFDRFAKICPPENIYIVTNYKYKEIVQEQLPQIHSTQILLEPIGRNTAPCIAYANHTILKRNANANIVVAPSDHLILQEDKFIEVATSSLEYVSNKEVLLTLGMKPNRPETGYGYIQIGDLAVEESLNRPIYKVRTFTEKPSLEIAEEFYRSGEFYWNSGIFFWNLKTILKSFDKYLESLNKLFSEGADFYGTSQEEEFIHKAYSKCQNISIDYGIMEKVSNADVYCADFGWSDLGTWGSLYEQMDKDDGNNAKKGDVLLYDTKNCVVHSENNKLIAVQGLDGYIVAESENALLICKKEEEQKIRQIVNDVKLNKGQDYI